MSVSLTLTTDEYTVLTYLISATSPTRLGPQARAAAVESLRRRGILTANGNVDLRVALVIAVLIRPRSRVAVSRFGSAQPDTIIAHQRLTDVVMTRSDGSVTLTPERDGTHVLRSRPAPGKEFSVAGRTWHDMVLQAPHSTLDQLRRLAELDGVDSRASAISAHLAKAHHARHDSQVLQFRGNRRWLGLEVSWVGIDDGTWLIDDGGRFGRTSDLDARRAVFTPGDPARTIRSLLGPSPRSTASVD